MDIVKKLDQIGAWQPGELTPSCLLHNGNVDAWGEALAKTCREAATEIRRLRGEFVPPDPSEGFSLEEVHWANEQLHGQ